MTAAVETYQDMAAFASKRTPAWHQLGTVFNEDVTTDQMLELAHLKGWNVRLEENEFDGDSARSWYNVVRDNPFTGKLDRLGIVGDRYRVFQNEQLLSFGDNLLDGASWETAGSIVSGTKVFASLALDRETILDPTGVADVVNNYLLVFTSHDGTTAINAMVTPVRVVCQNTLNMAIAGAKQSFKIRHTETHEGKVMAAREALGLTHHYIDEWDKAAMELLATEVTTDTVDHIFKLAYPEPEKDVKGALTKWQNRQDGLWNIYNGDTVGDGVRGTAWGAYNALTEQIDWFKSPRKGDASNVLAAASGFDPVTNAQKNKLLSLVKTVSADKALVRV